MKTGILLLIVCLGFTGISEAQTDEDRRTVMQQCLDLAQLQDYYHLTEHPERLPIVVKDNGKIARLSLSKFGQEVQFMTADELVAAGKNAYIEFVRFELSPESATVIYRYSAEGVTMTVLLKKVRGAWAITDSKLVER